ncbi:MAG: APC family permease [Gemmatimonas sp.]
MTSDPNRTTTSNAAGYDARLGLFSGTMLVIGGVIGAGIFLSPAVVAQRLGTAPLTLSAWGLGALVALIGAFVYAELGARIPKAGGTYVYLRDAFGSLPAFMYTWAVFLIIGSGAIAAVAMTCASYLTALMGIGEVAIKPIAVAVVLGVTALNIMGVQIGATAGNILTILKLGAIGALVLAALFLPVANAAMLPATAVAPVAPQGGMAVVIAMGTALAPVLFAFGGWQQANAVAEELRDPIRTLPKAMVLGVIGIVATYLLVNVAYLRALGVEGLAASSAPAAEAMFVYLGAPGRVLISAGIVISTLGFICLVVLMSARVYQAMAADGLFFAKMAELHPTFRTPVYALVAQAIVVLVLLFWGKYGALLDYVVFADWIFFASTAATVFVWRRRDKLAGRGSSGEGFRVPLHPLSTLIFIGAALYVVVGSILSNPGNAARGVGVFLLGVPVYLYWSRKR